MKAGSGSSKRRDQKASDESLDSAHSLRGCAAQHNLQSAEKLAKAHRRRLPRPFM
ncbi:hypothetical protein JI435_408710 [Parastagonospora nodorum SN15]|uniref:Uncharacterized protein n=1 Tax=Phaeosphaeria nodorum (strain SN15 / ATCC MYA-4574 / FGSC 10173) TaxID=321614 RepID=A0A7U2F0W2_PHANO|nr:hypothetical protein JI435_408710 [Parastagonospora nodorum SN15]